MDIEQSAAPQEGSAPVEATEPAQATALEGISEFTFAGNKYTPDGLHQILNEYKSNQEQLKDYNEDKRFRENLEVDLDNVLANPTLADRFKQIYPKRYHGIVDRMIRTGQAPPSQAPNAPAQTAFPKEFFTLLDDVSLIKSDLEKSKVAASSARLDALLPQLYKKYPLANQDTLFNRAEGILSSRGKDYEMSDADWDRLARESHASEKKRFDQFQAEELKRQLEKGRQGKDTGPGGSTPGQAPRRARTFDQAYDEMMKEIQTR